MLSTSRNGRNPKSDHYPESRFGGFSFSDAGVAFFGQINALLRPEHRVLDFGAGRGEHIIDDSVAYRRNLSNLLGKCAHVEGCDVDEAVQFNPFLDHAEIVSPEHPLPYPDGSFDLIFSRFVLEHVANPAYVAGELLRILKPGGVFVALTPNKFSYIALAGMLIPNRAHIRVLREVQPNRKAIDVFPTAYKLNSARSLAKYFRQDAEVSVVYFAGEPAYFFGSSILYGVLKLVHKYLPDRLRPLLIVFVQKA